MQISEIKIKEEDNNFLNEMKAYLALQQRDRANHRIFIMAAYLGLDLEPKEIRNLDDVEPRAGIEESYYIPEKILLKTSDEYNDLLIAARYTKNRQKISREEIQKIYEQESFNEDQELYDFLMERVLLGAKYFCSLIRNGEADQNSVDSVYNKLQKQAEKRILDRLNK